MKCSLFALSLLLLPTLASAQATMARYEFSSVAVDYPVDAVTNPNQSLQGTWGQTCVTVNPPTNANQTLAFGGFSETYVPFAYLAQVALDSFVGNANPLVLYGVGTHIPFTAETFNASHVAEGILSNAGFFADSAGKVKVLSSLNPAFAQSLSIKGPLWLGQNVALTFPSDPITGYPSASFTLSGGDANNDNGVDVADFGVMVNSYGGLVTDPASTYDPNADFNQDGSVDVADFGILVNNYSSTGDL